MKRYSIPMTVEYNGIEEDPEGEWVRYEDVKKEFHKYRIEHSICEDMVEELKEINKELLDALGETVDLIGYYNLTAKARAAIAKATEN